MTVKVTKLTMFRNKFSKVGRVANTNISSLQRENQGCPGVSEKFEKW